MRVNKYAIVCVLILLLLTTIAMQSINQAKASSNQFGWDNGNGYAAEIHACAAGITNAWTEDFTDWDLNANPPNTNGWGVNYNWVSGVEYPTIPGDGNPNGGVNLHAACSNDGTQCAIWNNFPLSSYACITEYVQFSQLDGVWNGGSVSIMALQGAPWPSPWDNQAVAIVTDANGYPCWTLQVNGGYSNTVYSSDEVYTGQWYMVTLYRDVASGYAALYVDGYEEAYSYVSTSDQGAWVYGTGITWQTGDGTNQLLVGDIQLQLSGDPTVYDEDALVQTAANQIFTLFSNTGYYGHLENYMYNNYYSGSTQSNVLGDIYRDETAYPYSAFLYIGHGGNPSLGGHTHYDFITGGSAGQDLTYLPTVYDFQVNGQLSNVDHYMTFLFVCFDGTEKGSYIGGPYPVYGMPYSWSNGRITSTDGYQASGLGSGPDTSGYSLISFQLASPMLSVPISFGAGNGNYHQLYKDWLVFYYYALLGLGYTVNQALNWASSMTGYGNFNSFPSYNGGSGNLVWWRMPGMSSSNWNPSIMREYGDGNIRIAPYSPW